MNVERIIGDQERRREMKRETQIELVLLKKKKKNTGSLYIEKEKKHSRKNATDKTAITNFITNLIQQSHQPPPANSR